MNKILNVLEKINCDKIEKEKRRVMKKFVLGSTGIQVVQNGVFLALPIQRVSISSR